MSSNDDKTRAMRREISRLVTGARGIGAADAWAGKRSATRFAEGMQLEVTLDPHDPTETWPVVVHDLPQGPSAAASVAMHNVSESGFSFWSKRNLRVGTLIHVREFSAYRPRRWIPARVKHSTGGIRGHLIGAAFETPDARVPLPPQAPKEFWQAGMRSPFRVKKARSSEESESC